MFPINNAQHDEYTPNEDNNNCYRQITIQISSRNKNIRWHESHLRLGSNHNSNCNNVSISTCDTDNDTMIDASFDNGSGEHIAYQYPNGITCNIMYSPMHEHYTHISTIKYKFNSTININNGMIIFNIIYSKRERVMLNGINIKNGTTYIHHELLRNEYDTNIMRIGTLHYDLYVVTSMQQDGIGLLERIRISTYQLIMKGKPLCI